MIRLSSLARCASAVSTAPPFGGSGDQRQQVESPGASTFTAIAGRVIVDTVFAEHAVSLQIAACEIGGWDGAEQLQEFLPVRSGLSVGVVHFVVDIRRTLKQRLNSR
ncbi:hypothetical protein E3A20_01850 [Planctomyces bekefii]|uniref:Uncharacterized protein n=1 Tax=Planctomyces bekefii TaxID=1653850 RepID=A0A5C6ME24_9PLAN|nr:hypothetical protein E3A20_01850 [Planctomyces bekefii]